MQELFVSNFTFNQLTICENISILCQYVNIKNQYHPNPKVCDYYKLDINTYNRTFLKIIKMLYIFLLFPEYLAFICSFSIKKV